MSTECDLYMCYGIVGVLTCRTVLYMVLQILNSRCLWATIVGRNLARLIYKLEHILHLG